MTKSFKRTILALLIIIAQISTVYAQDVYSESRSKWLDQAEALMPRLIETNKKPLNTVQVVQEPNAFQGWTIKKNGEMADFYKTSFKQQKSVVLDFGEHMTGYFSFTLSALHGASDAPTKFKLIFAEVPAEIATPYDPFPGSLSRGWLQDEIITVMDIPATVKLPRRFACRYVKIELLGSSNYFDFTISDVNFTASTSVSTKPEPLSVKSDPMIRRIDSIGLHTLSECMQTVYEDGPKRDRRLWIGDLYLESLANSYSFKNHDLTKRCLLLLAGLSNPDGRLIGTVFETPEPHPQVGQHLLDYSLLYNVTLKEYLSKTGDLETANSLWPIAKKQIDIVKQLIGKDGMVDYERANKEWWLFFDWKDGLDKQASIQGLTLFALAQTYELAKVLKKEQELKEVPALIALMKKAAMKNLFDEKLGLFVSGTKRQISYASQIWMVLGDLSKPAQSKKILTAMVKDEKALTPGGPYMYHYYIEALIKSGMNKEAKEKLVSYWGGMVNKGADTFWEVYDPKNELLSPYNFAPINSYCHAWSCTPVYFIRKYPQIFQ